MAQKSGVSEQEMLKTFNCGIGFCLIVKKIKLKKYRKFFLKNSNLILLVRLRMAKIRSS